MSSPPPPYSRASSASDISTTALVFADVEPLTPAAVLFHQQRDNPPAYTPTLSRRPSDLVVPPSQLQDLLQNLTQLVQTTLNDFSQVLATTCQQQLVHLPLPLDRLQPLFQSVYFERAKQTGVYLLYWFPPLLPTTAYIGEFKEKVQQSLERDVNEVFAGNSLLCARMDELEEAWEALTQRVLTFLAKQFNLALDTFQAVFMDRLFAQLESWRGWEEALASLKSRLEVWINETLKVSVRPELDKLKSTFLASVI